MPKIYEPISSLETLWREIDGMWICVSDKEIHECLADFLANHGFDIPECITYCLAESSTHTLKYRQSGGLISVFIKPIYYEQNSQN